MARSHREFAITALNRLAFGPSVDDLAKVDRFDFESYIDHQLHPEAIVDFDCDQKIAKAEWSTLSKPLKALWTDHRVAADLMRDSQKQSIPSAPNDSNAGAFKGGDAAPRPSDRPSDKAPALPSAMQDEQKLRLQPARETEAATWLRAVYSQRQLQEVLADFWHNHFNVFAWDGNIASVWVHYDRDVIRKHLFGNFREMLGAVAQSPAMLFYLDNFVNQSGNPNENYARELFELHTLGAENYLGTRDRKSIAGFAQGNPVGYVDGDVYEAARCFTGWRVDANPKEGSNSGEFTFYEPWHDRFQKIVLGKALPEYQPPMKDGNDVLDALAAHPGTARFIARKLCRRFVSDEPSPGLVQAVARVFHEKRKAPDQLRQVLRAILTSSDFTQIRRSKMKRPFEVMAGMLRSTGAEFFPSENFLNQYQRGGQRLFAWRSPDGYPDSHLRWGGATPMLERWRMANQLLFGKIEGVRFDLKSLIAGHEHDPADMAQAWSQRLLGQRLGDPGLKAIESFLKKDVSSDERHRGALALILMSPEFQWR